VLHQISYLYHIETKQIKGNKIMKRYYVRQMINGSANGPYAQFPAVDKAQSLIEGARHADALGIPRDQMKIAYIGKWSDSSVNPSEHVARRS
jgi:hypothetical protein